MEIERDRHPRHRPHRSGEPAPLRGARSGPRTRASSTPCTGSARTRTRRSGSATPAASACAAPAPSSSTAGKPWPARPRSATSTGGALRVEPLRGLPARHDLIVDMRPFFEGLARAGAALRPREPERRGLPVLPPGAGDRTAIEARNGCLTCGACVSAIAGEAAGADGVGPAALNRVLMLALDERDAAGTARLSAVAGEARGLSAEAMARRRERLPRPDTVVRNAGAAQGPRRRP